MGVSMLCSSLCTSAEAAECGVQDRRMQAAVLRVASWCRMQPYEREAARGLQYFSGVADEDIVGKPYRHMAADMQVCAAQKHVASIQSEESEAICLHHMCVNAGIVSAHLSASRSTFPPPD